MPDGFYAIAAVALAAHLWHYRHRPAIRRRLRGLAAGDRAYVYALLTVNEAAPDPSAARRVVDLALCRLGHRDTDEGSRKGGCDDTEPTTDRTEGDRP